ncbi:hypothetical protein TWF696_004676 [Orbilia brochopaga]|uniref:Uncharacterized protein n=1 Tax=Orbilia brochopaga TaxID=3140254 RepID=A0AAV9VDA6_9PEZI
MFPRRSHNVSNPADNSSSPSKPTVASSSSTLNQDPKLRPFLLPRSSTDPTAGLGTRTSTSGMTDRSNKPQPFMPFAPRMADFRDLMVPKKEGERCVKCGSEIVLNPRYRRNGGVNVAEPQPGQTVFLKRGRNPDGSDRVEEMVWSCRINRHAYPYPHEVKPHEGKGKGPDMSAEGEKNTQRPAATKMSVPGTERWVNEIKGLLNRGEQQKANEAMMQLVLMNEGKKPESFAWLEEHGESSKSRIGKGGHKATGGASTTIDKKNYGTGKADAAVGKKAVEAHDSISKQQKDITDQIEYGGITLGSSSEESLARSMAEFQPYQGYAAHRGRRSSFRPNTQLSDATLSHGEKKENVEQKLPSVGASKGEQKRLVKDQMPIAGHQATKSEGENRRLSLIPSGLFTGRHSTSRLAQSAASGSTSGKVSPVTRTRKSPKTSPSAFLGSLLAGFTDAKARARGITTSAAEREQADGSITGTATAPQPPLPPPPPVEADMSPVYATAGRTSGEEEDSGVVDTSMTDKTPSFMTDKSGVEGAGGSIGTLCPQSEEHGKGGKAAG